MPKDISESSDVNFQDFHNLLSKGYTAKSTFFGGRKISIGEESFSISKLAKRSMKLPSETDADLLQKNIIVDKLKRLDRETKEYKTNKCMYLFLSGKKLLKNEEKKLPKRNEDNEFIDSIMDLSIKNKDHIPNIDAIISWVEDTNPQKETIAVLINLDDFSKYNLLSNYLNRKDFKPDTYLKMIPIYNSISDKNHKKDLEDKIKDKVEDTLAHMDTSVTNPVEKEATPIQSFKDFCKIHGDTISESTDEAKDIFLTLITSFSSDQAAFEEFAENLDPQEASIFCYLFPTVEHSKFDFETKQLVSDLLWRKMNTTFKKKVKDAELFSNFKNAHLEFRRRTNLEIQVRQNTQYHEGSIDFDALDQSVIEAFNTFYNYDYDYDIEKTNTAFETILQIDSDIAISILTLGSPETIQNFFIYFETEKSSDQGYSQEITSFMEKLITAAKNNNSIHDFIYNDVEKTLPLYQKDQKKEVSSVLEVNTLIKNIVGSAHSDTSPINNDFQDQMINIFDMNDLDQIKKIHSEGVEEPSKNDFVARFKALNKTKRVDRNVEKDTRLYQEHMNLNGDQINTTMNYFASDLAQSETTEDLANEIRNSKYLFNQLKMDTKPGEDNFGIKETRMHRADITGRQEWVDSFLTDVNKLEIGEDLLWYIGPQGSYHAIYARIVRNENNELDFYISNTGAGTIGNQDFHPIESLGNKSVCQTTACIQNVTLSKEFLMSFTYFLDNGHKNISSTGGAENVKLINIMYAFLKEELGAPTQLDREENPQLWGRKQVSGSCTASCFWSMLKAKLPEGDVYLFKNRMRCKILTEQYEEFLQDPEEHKKNIPHMLDTILKLKHVIEKEAKNQSIDKQELKNYEPYAQFLKMETIILKLREETTDPFIIDSTVMENMKDLADKHPTNKVLSDIFEAINIRNLELLDPTALKVGNKSLVASIEDMDELDAANCLFLYMELFQEVNQVPSRENRALCNLLACICDELNRKASVNFNSDKSKKISNEMYRSKFYYKQLNIETYLGDDNPIVQLTKSLDHR